MEVGVLASITLASLAFASDPVVLKKGLYVPTSGNNESICPQLAKPVLDENGGMARLRIFYSGDCADDGPYWYDCTGPDFCGSELTQTFVIRDSEHYLWRNTQYDFWAEFELSPDGHD